MASPRRLLVGRAEHHPPQLVTVFPLKRQLALGEETLVLVQVADLSTGPASSMDFADLFGFSPAENRLARALMQGKTLQNLTTEFGVQMPTLRAQMRSVLRKCGVQRQVDLMRLLIRIQ